MRLISNYLYVIDRENETVENVHFDESQALVDYVWNVLNTVVESVGDREYNFRDGSITMRTSLDKIVRQEDVDATCKVIADRLLQEEIDAHNQIEHLGKAIPKGMLIISLTDMELAECDEYKIVISKADYNEFIEQTSGRLTAGLPTKKKIYKAFIANVSSNNVTKLTTYDSNTKIAEYWWKKFLELDVIRQNDINTKRAFDTIESEIINPTKKHSKQDFLNLWNITLGYFRLGGEFDLDHYRDEILGNYHPYSETVKVADLQAKCNSLPDKGKFDKRFPKEPKLLKGKKYKQIISLTNEIELNIKDYVPNMSDILRPYKNDAGEKFIQIKTSEGYEYAEKLKAVNNE